MLFRHPGWVFVTSKFLCGSGACQGLGGEGGKRGQWVVLFVLFSFSQGQPPLVGGFLISLRIPRQMVFVVENELSGPRCLLDKSVGIQEFGET